MGFEGADGVYAFTSGTHIWHQAVTGVVVYERCAFKLPPQISEEPVGEDEV